MGRLNSNHSKRGGGGGFRGGRGRGKGRGRGRGVSNNMDRDNWKNEFENPGGRIGVLSEETMSYYRNVLQTLATGFDEESIVEDGNPLSKKETKTPSEESLEAKDEFLNNVFSAFKEEAVKVSQNQTVSWMLETVFAQALPHHLRSVFGPFCDELTLVVFDRFASHVLQALVEYLPAMYQDIEEHEAIAFNECVKKLCIFMESHMRDIMTHTYGSHVLRSFIEALAGVKVKAEVVRQKQGKGARTSKKTKREKVSASSPLLDYSKFKAFSEDYQNWFQTLKDKIIRLCNFEDHMDDLNYTPVLQTVLLVLHKVQPDEYAQLSDSILQRTCIIHGEDQTSLNSADRLPAIVQSEVGSYLFELIVTLATPDQLRDIYEKAFEGRIMFFCVHSHANYVLQSFLVAINDEGLVSEILDEISKFFEDILAVNHVGIITKLAGACQRTEVGQDKFLQLLMTAFHCFDPPSRQLHIVPLVASFKTFDVFMGTEADGEKKEEPHLLTTVTLHGSLLLQKLLQFSEPKLIAKSLLQLTTTELAQMALVQCGSRVLDAFWESGTVESKYKDRFVKKMVGEYLRFATSSSGSRCLENIWKACSIEQRSIIAEDLCKHLHRLESDFFGKFIYENFGLMKFSLRRKEWLHLQGQSNRKQQLVTDVLKGATKKSKKERRDKAKVKEKHAPSSSQSETDQKQQADAPSKKKSKKSKKSKNVTAKQNVNQEEENVQISQGKKRKRKKEKKRLILDQEQKENPGVDDTEQVKPKKKKKKMKLE